MKTFFTLIFFLTFSCSANASLIVQCQTGIDDNLQIIGIIKSANTSEYNKDQKNLINPDISGVQNVAQKYIKCINGVVGEMTQVEKDVIDQAEADAILATRRLNADKHFTNKNSEAIKDRAFLDTILDEINVLRQAAGLQSRTRIQAVNSIRNKINSGSADQ